MMSEGFGLLVNLTDLNMSECTSIRSLPESETHVVASFIFLISNFGNLMSKGFGDLSNLETLSLLGCTKLELLPASKSRHSESFYFIIFVLRRIRRSAVPHLAQPFWRYVGHGPQIASRQ